MNLDSKEHPKAECDGESSLHNQGLQETGRMPEMTLWQLEVIIADSHAINPLFFMSIYY